MRLKHWVAVGFLVVGFLFVVHIVASHGGQSGFLSGIGLGRAG